MDRKIGTENNMVGHKSVRDTVMRSLMAIGSTQESLFYTNLFRGQAPERFALIVIDPRCLRHPLLEALISDLRFLSDLGLTPVLLFGVMDEMRSADNHRTEVRVQAQKIKRELENAGIKNTKLNLASYGLIPDVRKHASAGRFVILEMTETGKGLDIGELVSSLMPSKVIFLQPSGGFRVGDARLPVVNIDNIEDSVDVSLLSDGQNRAIAHIKILAKNADRNCTYIIASPLNLLQELFTVKGAGTMLRRAANVSVQDGYIGLEEGRLRGSIEAAFARPLAVDFFKRPISKICIEDSYRGGAIVTPLAGLDYLNKFWVTKEAQGEGIARDIWQILSQEVPSFFWRSRDDNPFNSWYIKMCDGMQVSGDWRVFWKGLKAPELPSAILAAASASHDFTYENKG